MRHGRADIIEFGRHSLHKFQSLNLLKNGVPSESTLCRVENGIEETGLVDRMAAFAMDFHEELVRPCELAEIICIDGKSMCGTVQEDGRCPDIV